MATTIRPATRADIPQILKFIRALAVYERARGLKNLTAEGVSCHIGSQLLDLAPYRAAFGKLARALFTR